MPSMESTDHAGDAPRRRRARAPPLGRARKSTTSPASMRDPGLPGAVALLGGSFAGAVIWSHEPGLLRIVTLASVGRGPRRRPGAPHRRRGRGPRGRSGAARRLHHQQQPARARPLSAQRLPAGGASPRCRRRLPPAEAADPRGRPHRYRHPRLDRVGQAPRLRALEIRGGPRLCPGVNQVSARRGTPWTPRSSTSARSPAATSPRGPSARRTAATSTPWASARPRSTSPSSASPPAGTRPPPATSRSTARPRR